MVGLILQLVLNLWMVLGVTGDCEIQEDDWLIHPPSQQPKLTEGTLGGVPILTLSNGLISRVFALPPSPQPRVQKAATCPNPGGRIVKRPDGSAYPYFGLPCGAVSDCGECALDRTCSCCPGQKRMAPPCCQPQNCTAPNPPAPPKVTGFATVGLSREGHAGVHAGRAADTQLLRASSQEATVRIDSTVYDIGGLRGQADLSFLNVSLLATMTPPPNAFAYLTHRTGVPQARYAWSPGTRHSDPGMHWPPLGLTFEIDFVAPASAPRSHQELTITVVYEMYTGVPVYSKWLRFHNAGNSTVSVNQLTTEILFATNEAMGYWPHPIAGSLMASSVSGRIHMESEMSRGGDTTVLMGDPRCTTCVQGNSQLVLNSSYPLGPGAEIGTTGFHGSNFTTYHTYVLLHDTDDTERQGLAIKRMYRTLAPQITENPVFMHLTDTSAAGIKSAVDQCAAAGFEMIIMSFGSGLNMESNDPLYIEQVAKSVAYAHSKGIEIGGYNLMSSSRTVAKGGNCIGPDGNPVGASCLASDWSDDYFATIKNFIVKTGFDMIETDGPYEGAECHSTTHKHHKQYEDSVWTQYERNMQFYEWCRERGMYIHAPDPFYMRGINKDGMGYVETNWNLPLWEQISLARQNIYDGTWSKIPSQGWMFVPIDQYHGGWPECCIEPVGFLAGQWEWYLAMYFGTGVSPCYRGKRIYDDRLPESLLLVQKYTAWNNKYRAILHSDLLHLKRADGNGYDAMLHVQADKTKSKERAFLIVFNQSPSLHVNATLRVPLYYSGLSTTTKVSREDGDPVAMALARDWTVSLHLKMAPNTITWYVFE